MVLVKKDGWLKGIRSKPIKNQTQRKEQKTNRDQLMARATETLQLVSQLQAVFYTLSHVQMMALVRRKRCLLESLVKDMYRFCETEEVVRICHRYLTDYFMYVDNDWTQKSKHTYMGGDIYSYAFE